MKRQSWPQRMSRVTVRVPVKAKVHVQAQVCSVRIDDKHRDERRFCSLLPRHLHDERCRGRREMRNLNRRMVHKGAATGRTE